MNPSSATYQLFPVGDSALTIDFGNIISEDLNREVIRRFHQLKESAPTGMSELVPAYSSLTVYFDPVAILKHSPRQTAYETIAASVEEILGTDFPFADVEQETREVPVCYDREFAPDLDFIASHAGIGTGEVIRLHTERSYRVYMLGFLPGFAYMGKLDPAIAVPRKPLPRQVNSGSVGIAGNQTGIYPLDSPGGWQIIGRTPLVLFDRSKEDPILLKAGDLVHFYPISRDEFENY
jgi:inhibitor of KinA